MKPLLYCIILLFGSVLTEASHDKNNLESVELQGNVRAMTESYLVRNELLFKKSITYKFNNSGFIESKTEYLFDAKEIFKYDEDYNITESKLYALDGKLKRKCDFRYENKKLIKKEYLDPQKQIFMTGHFKYKRMSDDNRMIERKEYDPDGIYLSHSSVIINSKDQIIVKTIYDDQGAIITSYEAKYDDNDNRIELTYLDAKGDLIWKWDKSYNEVGHEIRREMFVQESNETIMQYQSYEYDDHDNWIVKHIIEGNDTIKTIKRRIEYYE